MYDKLLDESNVDLALLLVKKKKYARAYWSRTSQDMSRCNKIWSFTD